MTTENIQDAIIKIYYYDFNSKIYTGYGDAELCQKTKKDYLIPYNAVTIPVPAYKHGKIPVYDAESNNWIIREDIRGIWYNKHTQEKIELHTLNAEIKEYTRIEPLPFSKWNEQLQCWEVDADSQSKADEDKRQKSLIEEAVYQLKNTAYMGLPHILALYSEQDQTKITDYHVELWEIIQDHKKGVKIDSLPTLDL